MSSYRNMMVSSYRPALYPRWFCHKILSSDVSNCTACTVFFIPYSIYVTIYYKDFCRLFPFQIEHYHNARGNGKITTQHHSKSRHMNNNQFLHPFIQMFTVNSLTPKFYIWCLLHRSCAFIFFNVITILTI